MPDAALKPALMRGLKVHEIGRNGDPYKLTFAELGQSGGSFGAMQGDLAKGQAFVRQTLRDALAAEAVPAATIEAILQKLSRSVAANPLTATETKLVDDALHAQRAKVDQMDERIAAEIFDDLDKCIVAAERSGRTIDPTVLLYIAMWINMTGAPDTLKAWLGGSNAPIPSPGNRVGVADIERYLRRSKHYTDHPRNFRHLQDSVADGAALLPVPA